jgi:hypothetical protein
LNATDFDYMFTGALAASYYGTPRTTMDIDIIIKISSRKEPQAKLMATLEKAGLKVEARKVATALKSGLKIATFRDNQSSFTVDIIFSSKKLERITGTILGLPTFYQTPEELILAKLRMILVTIPKERSLKDEEDVKAILRFTDVNIDVVKQKARRNNTLSTLNAILANINHQDSRHA